jgi:transposase-like protein
MYDEQIVQRFIELRASGRSYSRICNELNVTKPTLVAWSRKHQFQIQNLKAIELEALGEKWLTPVADRVNTLGGHLQRVESEIAKRDLTELSTPQLFVAARSLRRQIEQATGPTHFTVPVAEIPRDEYHEQVQDWQV